MKLLGYEFKRSAILQEEIARNVEVATSQVKKELSDIKVEAADKEQWISQAKLIIAGMRPAMDYMDRAGSGGIQMQRYPNYSLSDFYDLVYASDTLYTIISARTRAVFRNGYEIAPNFVRKCPECLTEYQTDNEECDECGAKTEEPDHKQRKDINILFDSFRTKVNANGQNFQTVHEAFDFDINVVDDGFILILFDYTYSAQGKILSRVPREIIRADPRILKIIAGPDGMPGMNPHGQPILFCTQHRKRAQTGFNCSECGKELTLAHYAALASGSTTETAYYAQWEVIHRSKFHPSFTYGISPVFKAWVKVTALMAQDKYINDYYTGQKPPKYGLIFDTNDVPGLRKQIESAKDDKNRSPTEPLILAVTRSQGSGPPAMMIDLMKSLDEMQYIEAREEMRRTIGAVWGVMPIFQGDLSQSGGLNNEGLQITVTGAATETDQALHNGVLREIVSKFGITDYTIMLKPFEEKDEMAEIQRDIARADHATRMQQLGYKIKLKPNEEFEFTGEEDGSSLKNDMVGQAPQQDETEEQTEGDKKFAASYAGAPVAKSMDAYSNALHIFGDTAKGVGWKDRNSQEKRFDIFLDVIKDEKEPEVLDAGCGTGHLYEYMKSKGFRLRYKGIDTNLNMVASAKAKGLQAFNKSIAELPDNESDDYVFSSGVHNFGPCDIATDMKKLYAKCRKAFVINMLSKKAGEGYNEYNTIDMIRIAHKLAGAENVYIRKDYLPDDFTLILRKPQQIEKRDTKGTKEIRENAEDMEDELSKELRKILRNIDIKKKMTESEMRMVVRHAAEKIGLKLKNKSDAEIRNIYKTAQERVEKEMNINIVFGKRDENAIQVLKNDKIFADAFRGFEEDTQKKLADVITEAYEKPEELTLDRMVKNMREVANESEGRLMNIARTESNHISNIARDNSYSQIKDADKLIFKWLGPDDDRTTPTCKRIKARTKDGVPKSQLKAIIQEEAARDGFTARDYTPHYSCRHTFIRII